MSPQFEKHLAIGWQCPPSDTIRSETTVATFAIIPGKQIARFALHGVGGRCSFLFVSPPARQVSGEVATDLLKELYQHAGWECADILKLVRHSDDFYFDDVSQIRISRWSEGRVLIGDACFCPSLLAGQGAALAMGAAYILAGELKVSGGDYSVAFRRCRTQSAYSRQAAFGRAARTLVSRRQQVPAYSSAIR